MNLWMHKLAAAAAAPGSFLHSSSNSTGSQICVCRRCNNVLMTSCRSKVMFGTHSLLPRPFVHSLKNHLGRQQQQLYLDLVLYSSTWRTLDSLNYGTLWSKLTWSNPVAISNCDMCGHRSSLTWWIECGYLLPKQHCRHNVNKPPPHQQLPSWLQAIQTCTTSFCKDDLALVAVVQLQTR